MTKTAKKTSAKKTLVLLDAHAILHRAYHALPDFTSPTGEPTGALYGVVAMLLKIVEELKPDYIVSCFDLPDPTYRHQVYEGYKATRTKTDDLLVSQIERSRDVFAAFGIPILEHPGFEADDILGTLAHQFKDEKDLRIIIASGDMDTLQLVQGERVTVYTLKKGIKDTILYTEKLVKERFGFGPKLVPDYKGLRGDPSDNIPGVKGIGEKSATDLIVAFGSIEDLYKKLKKNEKTLLDAGIKARIVELLKASEEEALFSKMLATIRRDAPVTYALPQGTWRENLDVEKVLTLFSVLGFRTLGVRVKSLFGVVMAEEVSIEAASVDPRTLTETTIALWLLNSDMTSPTIDDVISYRRTEDRTPTFEEARKEIFADLEADPKLQALYTTLELPLMDVLDSMRKVGITIDVPYLKTLSKKFHKELTILEERIYGHAGVTFNINSPKQLGEILYDTLGLKPKNQKKTAMGQRSTRESELEKLIDEHAIIKEILRYRELQKLVSTYVDTLPDVVQKDGRIHPTFLQAGAVTGRMASENPSVQNIPIRTDEGRAIRRAFMAEEGFDLVAIDYSQIELRIAAILSHDEKLMEIFKRGEDVHRGVASRVFGVSEDEVTPDMRRQAKVINFGILYGMGVNALKANLGEGTSRAAAQEFLTAYFNTFTRLAEYLEETKAYARRHGFTETLFGRRRHFPGMNSSAPFIRAQAERMAINAPVQGTAADVARIAMVRIHEYLSKEKLNDRVHMMLQVHDELVFEIKKSDTKKIVPKLKEIMEGVLTNEEGKGVPISAEVKVGPNWEEMSRFNAK